MSTILDVIMAVIAGSIVIVTIMITIIKINQMNYNLQTMMNLQEDSNLVITAIDEAFLEPVGNHLHNFETAITHASAGQFSYNFRAVICGCKIDEPNWMTDCTHPLQSATITTEQVGTGFRLIANSTWDPKRPGMPMVFQTTVYPLTTGDIFTYYDVDENVTNNLSDIRSVKFNFEFRARGWYDTEDEAEIRYPVAFWRYFKNIYIQNIPT